MAILPNKTESKFSKLLHLKYVFGLFLPCQYCKKEENEVVRDVVHHKKYFDRK